MTNRSAAWVPAILWCGLLFGLSCIPGSAIPDIHIVNFDKVVHAVLYGVMGALFARALGRTTRAKGWGLVAAAGLLATAYGVTDELHQLFTPRRSCDVRDALADALGGFTGASIWMIESIRRRGKSKPAL